MKPLIVVSSAIANKPNNGGNARMVLNWIEGLTRLGAEVFFLEQIRSDTLVDRDGAPSPAERERQSLITSIAFCATFGLSRALRSSAMPAETLEGATIHGATAAELHDLARDADLLINISGHLSADRAQAPISSKGVHRSRSRLHAAVAPATGAERRVWKATMPISPSASGLALPAALSRQAASTGSRSGSRSCSIRAAPTASPSADRFTTVASWRGAYAPVTYEGETYRVKAHEFRKIVGPAAPARPASSKSRSTSIPATSKT